MENEELIDLINELIALPKENEWVEFKKGTATTNEKLGQYISALSNSACIENKPFGYLLFGIENDTHRVVGTSFKFKNAKEGNEELELWIRRMLSPSIRFEHFVCQYDSTSRVELFRIPTAKAEPTNFKNIPYIRINTSLTDLRKYPDLIRTIYNSEIDWSAQIIEKASMADLSSLAIATAKDKFKEKNVDKDWYNQIDDWDDATFLDKAKITVNGKITNTAIIFPSRRCYGQSKYD
ncbi:hypothetical protein AGMMS49965_15140 [Bacteroidia bacterium]|nr:hypothetical protein AGMMS49965_15140 [Bacteroidia bacterium]